MFIDGVGQGTPGANRILRTVWDGDGADEIRGGGGDDQIIGDEGNDTLYGDGGRDIIYGNADNDTIYGGDEVGAGDFILGGTGNDEVHGGDGADTIYGNEGIDTLYGDGGRDIIYGNDDNDVIYGGNEVGNGDLLLGGAGADQLYGNDGDDQLYGGTGADQLSGGDGRDILYADSADTLVSGGAGTDYLVVYNDTGGTYTADDIENWYGTSGAETFNGSGNSDTQIMQGYGGADIITGGNGNDYLLGGNDNDILTGGSGNDQLYGDAGADQLTGGAGSDILFFDANDTLVSGGADYDYALVQAGSGSVTLNMTAGQIEYARGSENGDILSADGYNAHVTIVGGGGNDSLYAGYAGSFLNGGNGADNIVMGTVAATDSMLGGAGADTFWLRDNGGIDFIYDFEDGTDLINATLITSNTVFGSEDFSVNSDNAASGWFALEYAGGNILWIQAGSEATIDENDFILPASGDMPPPEASEVAEGLFDFAGFEEAGDNGVDWGALVAEYDAATPAELSYNDSADVYGLDGEYMDMFA